MSRQRDPLSFQATQALPLRSSNSSTSRASGTYARLLGLAHRRHRMIAQLTETMTRAATVAERDLSRPEITLACCGQLTDLESRRVFVDTGAQAFTALLTSFVVLADLYFT
jgi:hypothetical protein